MAESREFPGRYLSYGFASMLTKRPVERRHQLTPSVEVTIHDSDPFELAIFWKAGNAVAVENCIINVDQWLYKTMNDPAFLKHLDSL